MMNKPLIATRKQVKKVKKANLYVPASESERFKIKQMKSMMGILENHPYSFMFDYQDTEEHLTPDDVMNAIKKGKVFN